MLYWCFMAYIASCVSSAFELYYSMVISSTISKEKLVFCQHYFFARRPVVTKPMSVDIPCLIKRSQA